MVRSEWLKIMVAALIFIAVMVTMTYPLVFKVTKVIPGFFSTDEPYAVLWDHWRDKSTVAASHSLGYIDQIAYPFGINLKSGQSRLAWNLWQSVNLFLGVIFSIPLSYNLQVIINFFLGAFIMYLLVFYLAGNRLSAVFSGLIFGFCPYQFVRSWQHLGATYNYRLPLIFLAVFLLKEKPSRRTNLFLLISVILLFSFDYYLVYFALIGLLLLLLYIFLYQWKAKLTRGGHSLVKLDMKSAAGVFFIFMLTFILLLPQHYPLIEKWLTPSSVAPSAWNTYSRPFEDLFAQSARPLSFFLPPITHPVFGKFTENFIGTPLYGESVTEHTLYLGWIPLILAFVAFKNWRKRRQLSAERDNFYIGFFILLAVVAWLFAQPPWWKVGQVKIFMPSYFMYKILPMFRAYCRFGIVLMFAVAVLAGFGLKFILGRFKSDRIKIFVAVLVSCMVLFEFWSWPPYKVIDVSRFPAVYDWLQVQPGDFVIAEYPLDAVSPNEKYKFYQTRHEKKIVNGTIPGSGANLFAKTITDISNPNVAKVLKGIGVKYVVVHRDKYLNTDLIKNQEELEKIPKNSGLRFIQRFPAQGCPQEDIMCIQRTGEIDVYEVTHAN